MVDKKQPETYTINKGKRRALAPARNSQWVSLKQNLNTWSKDFADEYAEKLIDLQQYTKEQNEATRKAVQQCIAEEVRLALGKKPEVKEKRLIEQMKVKDEEMALMTAELNKLKKEKKRDEKATIKLQA